jgi:hypothetical protein
MALMTDDDVAFCGPEILTCDFCGGKAHAYWRGERNVTVCDDCAARDLPKLAADAVAGFIGGLPGGQRLEWFFQRFEKEFWRAAALATCRKGTCSNNQQMRQT